MSEIADRHIEAAKRALTDESGVASRRDAVVERAKVHALLAIADLLDDIVIRLSKATNWHEGR